MAISDNKYLFNVLVTHVYRDLQAGCSLTEISQARNLDTLAEEDRELVFQEAKRIHRARQKDLGLDGKSEIIIGITLLAGIGLILLFFGYPEAGRHVGIMRLAIIGGICSLGYGAYLKFKSL